jgi:subtilisin family serine protease
MIHHELPLQVLPEYHEQLLIVRFQPAMSVAATTAMSSMSPEMTFGSLPAMSSSSTEMALAVERTVVASLPGLTSTLTSIAPGLHSMLRTGMIRKIMPLSRQSTTGVGTFLGAIAASFTESPSKGQRILGGTSILELERGVEINDAKRRLGDDPQIQFVSRVPVRYMSVNKPKKTVKNQQTVALAAPPQSILWNLQKIKWAESRSLPSFKDANDIQIAVLDTGIDQDHPDFGGRVSSYVYQHPDDTTVSGEKDIVGHGTHVAGTICAKIGNAIGIDGICQCKLRVWKIFTDQTRYIPQQNQFTYAVNPIMYRRALADCIDEGIDILNLSIGGPAAPEPQELQLFNALIAGGTTICAAMGNERSLGSPTAYPAAIEGVIAVGATTIDDTVTGFSNRGDHISLAAPGKAIWSTLPTYAGQLGFDAIQGPNGLPKEGKAKRREINYDAWDGTSMATPHVTAAAALYNAKTGEKDPAVLKQALQKNTDKVSGMGNKAFHPDYGTGRLNLLKLLL